MCTATHKCLPCKIPGHITVNISMENSTLDAFPHLYGKGKPSLWQTQLQINISKIKI